MVTAEAARALAEKIERDNALLRRLRALGRTGVKPVAQQIGLDEGGWPLRPS